MSNLTPAEEIDADPVARAVLKLCQAAIADEGVEFTPEETRALFDWTAERSSMREVIKYHV